MSAEKKVGLFFIVAVVSLVVLVELTHELHPLRSAITLRSEFPDVKGLGVGDPVTLAGVEVGEVKKLGFTDHGTVEVLYKVYLGTPVRADSRARIMMTNMIAGQYAIALDTGSPSAPLLEDGATVPTGTAEDLQALLKLARQIGEDLRHAVRSFDANQEKAFGQVQAMIEENRDDVRVVVSNLREAAPEIKKLSASLRVVAARVEQGQGTLGKLVNDPELYDEARAAVRDLHKAATGLQHIISENEGRVDAILADLREAMPQLHAAVKSLGSVARKIDQGSGTLGKLINDDALYGQVQQAVASINEAAEGVREQTPVAGLTSVLLGAF